MNLEFADTAAINNITYHYRVVGITAFGEESEIAAL